MSALCEKQTFCAAVKTSLFDDLVGGGEQRLRNIETERFGGFEIDHELEFGWLLDWKVRGLRSLKNFVNIAGGAPIQVTKICSVGQQTPSIHKHPQPVYRKQSSLARKLHNLASIIRGERIFDDDHRTRVLPLGGDERTLDIIGPSHFQGFNL